MLTLLVIVLLVVIVTGFLSTTRVEQMAARNYSFQSSAEQMAQLATHQAIALLRSNYQRATSGVAFATQPGAITVFQGGSSLSLTNFSTGAIVTNINALVTNGLVTANTSQVVNVGLQTVTNHTGGQLGRYAFFIDDESTKLPINSASPSRNSLNPLLPRPFSIKGVDPKLDGRAVTGFSNILTGSFSNSTISNWFYFFTAEQAAKAIPYLTEAQSRHLTVASETNAALAGKTPWGTDKIRINQVPLTDAGVQQMVQALSDPKLTQVFGQTFAGKYTTQGLPQIAANMLQLRTDHWRGGAIFDGTNAVLGSDQVTGTVNAPAVGPLKKTNGIPPSYLGYVPFPMLSQIDVSFVFGWQNPAPDNSMTIRVILTCVLTNPFPTNFPPGGQFFAQIDKASFELFYPGFDPGDPWRGPDGSIRSAIAPHNDLSFDNPWGSSQQITAWNLNPTNGIVKTNLPAIGAMGSAEVSVHYDMSFKETNPVTQIRQAYIIIDQIKILSQADDARSIRDWCSGNDFFNALTTGGADGPAQFMFPNVASSPALAQPASPFAARGPLPITAPPPPAKLVRADPRLRPSLANSEIYKAQPPGKAWNSVLFTAAAPSPADFSDDPIPSDLGDAQSVLYNTNLPPAMFLPDGSYALAADLGKVFTGYPWRTLRMQSQPAIEASAGLIPDWVLLDAVDFGVTGQAVTTVNPNFVYASAAAAPVVGFGAGLRSQLDVLTNTNDTGALASLASPLSDDVTPNVPGLLAAGAGTNQAGISNMLAAVSTLTNTSSWARGAQGWKSRRDALKFPPGALLLPSEITELSGFANYETNTANLFKANEYRLGALFPGLSTKSRFFKIHALGEAFEGTNQAVAATSLLQTLVEVDVTTDPISIRTIYQHPQNQ